MKHIDHDRWEEAQNAERFYWDSIDLAEMLRIVAEKPAFMKLLDNRISLLLQNKAVLELGCGPLGIGVVNFCDEIYEANSLVKIEPLPYIPISEVPLLQKDQLASLRQWLNTLARIGEYRQQMAESIDYHNEFDTVITYNVLDHVQDPYRIVVNSYHALKKGGVLVIGVDCRSVLGHLKFEHLTRRFYKDTVLVRAHPYSFLPGHVTAMMKQAGFTNIEIQAIPPVSPYLSIW